MKKLHQKFETDNTRKQQIVFRWDEATSLDGGLQIFTWRNVDGLIDVL